MSTQSNHGDRSAAQEGQKGKQDTPGRPKPGSSRQQTQPGQTTQTGSPEIDSKSAEGKGRRKAKPGESRENQSAEDVDYRDRPSDDGKHGDARRAPNEGFPRR